MSFGCKREEKAQLKPTRGSLQGRRRSIQIPSFNGRIDSDAYLAWEKEMEFLFGLKHYTEKKKVCLAVTGLCGSAFTWWHRVAQTRRFDRMPELTSWVEMKTLMRKRFVLQWELPEIKPVAATKFITLDQFGSWSELPSKPAKRRLVVPDLSHKQEEEKLQTSIAASQIKQTEESHESEPEPTTLCLKQEEEAQVAQAECDHVLGQRKQEEKVVGGSSKATDLVLADLVEQGDAESVSCDQLTKSLVCVQRNLVDYLRFVKGLQQVVFEPGGSLSVSRRSNNNLVQKTVSYKLDLQGSFTPEEQDLRSNLFEGREDGVILSSCSKHRGGKGGNTFLIRSITDQNKLRRVRQKLVALSSVCNEIHLRHERGLQHFVFKPGEEVCVCRNSNQSVVKRARRLEFIDQGSVILQGSDLRSNPFEGREYGAILISLKLNGMKAMYELAMPLIMVQLNGQFHGLIGMIYEVLDREKDKRLDTTSCSHGMIMDQ